MSSSLNATKRAASKKRLSFLCPAKINLFFRVLRKREDGFHEIASLFQAIALFDTLSVAASTKDHFTCSDPSLLMDEKNLVCKALKLFREKTGILDPVEIHLEKKIPMQAGLGGGSSNAAMALFALSELFSTDQTLEELQTLGASLGSDVPFFFSSGTAYCTGRGENLQNMPFPKSLSEKLWIAKPKIGLSTPLVYSLCKPDTFQKRDPEESLSSFYSENTPIFYNDLEEPAFLACPELQKIKEDLLKIGFEHVVLSGSGTSFFCLGSHEDPQVEGIEFFQVGYARREDTRWLLI